jgi:catechol 2,3-dioxygenase-like lactoylglutathione lyase family enzyme
MASAKVLATNHTGFTVSDLTAMIGFFTQALGFELISRAPRDPINSAKLTGAKKIELEIGRASCRERV